MDWLVEEILIGFQKLMCLSMERQPASEIITGTAQVWVETLTDGRSWDQQRDRQRIRSAFVTLARTHTTWPQPKHFLEALPKAEPLRAIPSKPANPQRAQHHIEQARALLQPYDRKTAAAGGD